MRIEAYTQIQQAYKTSSTGKNEQAKKSSFSDQLQISSLGKDIQTVKQAVLNTPDVREEITSPIKESIQAGTYQVNPNSFADKLLKQYNERGII